MLGSNECCFNKFLAAAREYAARLVELVHALCKEPYSPEASKACRQMWAAKTHLVGCLDGATPLTFVTIRPANHTDGLFATCCGLDVKCVGRKDQKHPYYSPGGQADLLLIIRGNTSCIYWRAKPNF